MQAIIEAISTRSSEDVKLELGTGTRADLHDADLSRLTMIEVDDPDGANLSLISFDGTDLSNARFVGVNLSRAFFTASTKLHGATFGRPTSLAQATFHGTDMSNVHFLGVDLSATKFSVGSIRSYNLTQTQLDMAVADPDNPPVLTGLIDPSSGKPLMWRGQSS